VLLTGGVVENRPLGTAANVVERKHRHQVRVAALAVVGAVVAGGVEGLVGAGAARDEDPVAVGVKRRIPGQRAVSRS